MNIIFLNSQTLVTRELNNALKKRKDIRLINVPIPVSFPSESVDGIFTKSVVKLLVNFRFCGEVMIR